MARQISILVFVVDYPEWGETVRFELTGVAREGRTTTWPVLGDR